LDGGSGRPLSSLPLFARHDLGAGKKVLPISTTTGRAIVHKHVSEALGPEAAGTITPHSFRHYFVTTVLRGSGGNLKLAQELAFIWLGGFGVVERDIVFVGDAPPRLVDSLIAA
jgi:hypothetical protein